MNQIGKGRAFCGWGMGCFYFRIFDYGLHFEWNGEPSFSERMGIKNCVRVGKLVARTLRPWR